MRTFFVVVSSLLSAASAAILFYGYYLNDTNLEGNVIHPWNSGKSTLSGILVLLALPLLLGKIVLNVGEEVAERRYKMDINKQQLGVVRAGANGLLLMGASVILGLTLGENLDSVGDGEGDGKIPTIFFTLSIIYVVLQFIDRLLELPIDFANDIMFMFKKIADKEDSREFKVVAPKMRTWAVLFLLVTSMVAQIFMEVDNNDSDTPVTNVYNDGFQIASLAFVGLHIALVLISLAVQYNEKKWEDTIVCFALSEISAIRTVVVGAVVFFVGVDFGYLWFQGEATYLVISLVSVLLADQIGRNCA